MTVIKAPKKLIEVALPLDDISAGCEQEKNPFLKGHPRSMHLWWARRPLAAARAVLFSQLVNDPSETVKGDKRTKAYKAEVERKREELFGIIKDLAKWENINNKEVLDRAKKEIEDSWKYVCDLNSSHPNSETLFDSSRLPGFHDPFGGGGALPLEAQRLGLESYASDLNPIAVMINKAMIEIPPRFQDIKPVGPMPKTQAQDDIVSDWSGSRGLSEDVRRYADWIKEKAITRIGRHYPRYLISSQDAEGRENLLQYIGEELPVVAWIWARTVKSPSPICSDIEVPLISTYVLSTKKGKECYIEPVISDGTYSFAIRNGKLPEWAKQGNKLARGANFECILSKAPISSSYIKQQGRSGGFGYKLIAVVLAGNREKVFLPPRKYHEEAALMISETCRWDSDINGSNQYLGVRPYGMDKFSKLYTSRQLLALSTYVDLINLAVEDCYKAALLAGMSGGDESLESGGVGAKAYAQSIGVYLSFSLGHISRYSSTICGWNKTNENVAQAFGRQAIPMVWDFAESNPLDGSLDFRSAAEWVASAIPSLSVPGFAAQASAQSQEISKDKVVSTDPPYYDNVPYADISDYFYTWLRGALRDSFPNIFSTLSTPKKEELVAFSYRHESKEDAEGFFLSGMKEAMSRIRDQAHPAFPITIYYAFKSSETKEGETVSAGWLAFIEAVIAAGLTIDGTWPMRTERVKGLKGSRNALASSIVLVCRKKPEGLAEVSRRDFQKELRIKMPESLAVMIGGESGQAPIAPVDLSQAAIGPGMAIYSGFSKVLNQDGSLMSVRDALALINRSITEFLSPDSAGFDPDTQFCANWFDQFAWNVGPFGDADILARAKGTSVDGVKEAGVVESGAGKVRLLKWGEYQSDWDPTTDNRTPVWEACHQMIRRLNNQGESAAGELLAKMPEKGEPIRQLAYHLYTLCERKKWAEEARAYNELIASWHAIVAASHELGHAGEQAGMDF